MSGYSPTFEHQSGVEDVEAKSTRVSVKHHSQREVSGYRFPRGIPKRQRGAILDRLRRAAAGGHAAGALGLPGGSSKSAGGHGQGSALG